MSRLRRWWLRNFVYGHSLYDFAVLTVRKEEAETARLDPVFPPGKAES